MQSSPPQLRGLQGLPVPLYIWSVPSLSFSGKFHNRELTPPCSDAVPKKRGPKTDVLEALLKRVDGLEKRLQDENHPLSPASSTSPVKSLESQPPVAPVSSQLAPPPPPPTLSTPSPSRLPDSMLDAYFGRLHGKPYFILDESSTRQRHQRRQLSPALSMAIYAVTLR